MARSIIAVLQDAPDVKLVEESLRGQDVEMHLARSSDEALGLLAVRDTAVILYDADSGQPWQEALPRFLKAQPGSRVILLAHSVSHTMWVDMFDFGGFDLIYKTIRPVDLRAIIRAALSPPKFFLASVY